MQLLFFQLFNLGMETNLVEGKLIDERVFFDSISGSIVIFIEPIICSRTVAH